MKALMIPAPHNESHVVDKPYARLLLGACCLLPAAGFLACLLACLLASFDACCPARHGGSLHQISFGLRECSNGSRLCYGTPRPMFGTGIPRRPAQWGSTCCRFRALATLERIHVCFACKIHPSHKASVKSKRIIGFMIWIFLILQKLSY